MQYDNTMFGHTGRWYNVHQSVHGGVVILMLDMQLK